MDRLINNNDAYGHTRIRVRMAIARKLLEGGGVLECNCVF
jgi:hypothetical protein